MLGFHLGGHEIRRNVTYWLHAEPDLTAMSEVVAL